MSYYPNNNTEPRNIYNLLDNLDYKLSQRSRTNTYYFPKNQNNINIYNNKNLGNYRNNSALTSAQFNQKDLPNNTQVSNYQLRKIIKEEFDILIKPIIDNYHELKSDITHINNNNSNNNLLNSRNDLYTSQNLMENMKKNLYDYVPFKDFQKKMKELEEKIDKNYKNEKMAIYSMSNDIKYVKAEVQEIQKKYEEIEKSINLTDKNKNNYNEMNKNDDKLKEIKLKQIKLKEKEDSISFLQKNFETLKENVNDIKNKAIIKLLDDNNSMNELKNKYDSLNNFDIKYNQVNTDIAKLKVNIQKLNGIISELNNRNSNYENNFNNNMNSNINYESRIQDTLKKLGLEKDKVTIVFQNYEQLLKNYIKLSKIVEYQNNLLNDLNLKFKNLNQKNEVVDNNDNEKYDLLDRQIQYMKNQLERISIDLMNNNKNDNDYKIKKENILLLQKDIENIKKDIGEINRLIENEQTKKDEENEKINKLLSEIKEENKKKIEESANKVEEENRLTSIEEKIKKLEEEIVKLKEEISKELDEKIVKLNEEKTTYANNIDNENMLKQIEIEVKRIDEDLRKFEEEKKKKIEEEKIKRIEDENRLKINEEKIKKLDEDKYDERLTKLEEKLKMIEKNLEKKVSVNINQKKDPPPSIPLDEEDKSSDNEYIVD